MSDMTKEQFIEKCNEDITLMTNVCGMSFDECAEMMFVTYNSFQIDDMSAEEINRIVNELNKVQI